MMLTMGEACDGPHLPYLLSPEGGGGWSTPLETAPAVESLERVDDEDSAWSGELVVEVREVVLGGLGLELTIRVSDECGEVHEVCNDAIEARPAPEERSSDAVSDLPAGADFGNFRAALWVDAGTSGDGREVRADLGSSARDMADVEMSADAKSEECEECELGMPSVSSFGTTVLSDDSTGSTDRCPTLDARRPMLDARRLTPDARRPTPDARRPTPDARRPTPDARRPTPDARRPVLTV